MKKSSKKLIGILIVILLACIYYYVTIPAINIHSSEFWIFIILLIVALLVYYIWKRRLGKDEIKQSKVVKGILFVLLGVVLIYGVGTLLSSPIVNAKKYQKLLTVKDGEFTKDIEELSFDQIPLLDKDSATILGNRKMGSMVDMVSQFEVDDIYTQINYRDKPVRVSPLRYANPIKWLTNQSDGIPAYIRIDMATQTTELVKLEEGMKYSTSEYFNRNIYRHLRFKYPTYILMI